MAEEKVAACCMGLPTHSSGRTGESNEKLQHGQQKFDPGIIQRLVRNSRGTDSLRPRRPVQQ
jgi:hypothetical protein